MKAAVILEHGGLENLRIENIEGPRLDDDEVLIDVQAAALNHLDIWIRKGRPGLELPMPHVLGSDACGIVREAGARVGTVKPGDRVIINPGLSCEACEFCMRGQQSECINFGIVGMSRPGTCAESVSVPASCVYLAPEHLTSEEAAALPLAYVTAWRMLMSRGRLQPGETVLIHGIGGGVALAALQLAKLAGGRAIVTSSSNQKLNQAREFGAEHTINYADSPDVGAAVFDLTDGRGVDLIIDTVGAATWPVNFAAARRGGRVVHCGVTTGAETAVNISALYWNHLTIMGSTMGSQEDFRQMLSAISGAGLRPVIDKAYPLSEARTAQARMEAGEQFGKIVLTVGSDADVEKGFVDSMEAVSER